MNSHRPIILLLALTLVWPIPQTLSAAAFRCAGSITLQQALPLRRAAKIARVQGQRSAVALFAKFRGELSGQTRAPAWSETIFDPQRPGSFSHFYATMSFGRLQMRGAVAPGYYEVAGLPSAYLAGAPAERGKFGRFNLEILRQADTDVDFSRFDNDGPDGAPNSGDDDGIVDVVFIITASAPAHFLRQNATGIAELGFDEDFLTDDLDPDGHPIRISPNQGTVQQGQTYAEAVGVICHEYGHILGLPDLFNSDFLLADESAPEKDSAGIGRWGLMGWGATGWHSDDGPNSFSAWSRMRLGWATVAEMTAPLQTMNLPQVGLRGDVFRIPLNTGGFYLVEHRLSTSTYYDRHIPGEGVLIWHINTAEKVDLECADGRWHDAGYPLGLEPAPTSGGDNLDFWAHDPIYARRFGGNLGDATDPFDGIRYRSFTPETNPATRGSGSGRVRLTDLVIDGPVARARAQTDSMHLEIAAAWVVDANQDGFLTHGEDARLHIRLRNRGGVNIPQARAILSTDEPQLDILQDQAHIVDIRGGLFSNQLAPGESFPRFRVGADFPGEAASLRLDVYVGAHWASQRIIPIEVRPTLLLSGRLADAQGAGLEDIIFSLNALSRRGSPNGRSITFRTGADGYFAQDAVPGRYSFYFLLASQEELPLGRSFFADLITVDPERDQHLTFAVFDGLQLSMDLRRTVLLSGATRGPEGRPLAGVAIQAQWDGGSAEAQSRADGAYALRVPRGPLTIRAERTAADVEAIGAHRFSLVQGNRERSFDMVLHPDQRPTAVSPTANDLPERAGLDANYPNPFNAQTTIIYQLPQKTLIKLDVYTILGRKVATLVQDMRTAGIHTAHWNSRDDQGRQVASGVYLARLQLGDLVETRKMVLVR
ncbi:MAG: T9SS type A sorting domain-containing protein [Candidatus Latescibacteria bacterium]|nr:T9SS type A sorting domain-containing protein [Candidatus Latescibacterota bacterium]